MSLTTGWSNSQNTANTLRVLRHSVRRHGHAPGLALMPRARRIDANPGDATPRYRFGRQLTPAARATHVVSGVR